MTKASTPPHNPTRSDSIQRRMTLAFALIVLLPLLVTALVSALLNIRSAEQRLYNQLESVASLKEAEINTWADQVQSSLLGMFTEADVPALAAVLQPSEATSPLQHELSYTRLQSQLQRYLTQDQYLEEIFLLNSDGKVMFSTDHRQEGKRFGAQALFQEGMKAPYLAQPLYSPSLGRIRIIASQPLPTRQGKQLGVVAVRARLNSLNRIMLERPGLEETGETYLVGSNYTLLTVLRDGTESLTVRSNAALHSVGSHSNGSGLYINPAGKRVYGVYHWIPRLRVALLAEQTQQEALEDVWVATWANLAVALAALLIALAVAYRITRSLTKPLSEMAYTAEQIAAGNLSLKVPVYSRDEIGALAQAFNSMGAQLQGMITGLERRVADRTADLNQRSLLLQTASEVARDLNAAKDLDTLMQRAVDLVRDRFGFYHAGLFLLDERREYAVLRAATGDAGQQMLAREHKLQVGQEGLVGHVAASGQARISLMVEVDAAHYHNPSLPQTRSEMALPLNLAGVTIGVLDVQSERENAFSEEDINVLQTMADQLASALENARLLEQMNQTLTELGQAYGQYTNQSWRSFIQARQKPTSYRSNQFRTGPVEDLHPEVFAALKEKNSYSVQVKTDALVGIKELQALAVPIQLRNQVIGVLNLRFKGEKVPAGVQEFVEEVANRLALVLENARLLEEARQQTAREQQIGDITSHMRQSLNIEMVLKTAAQELFTALGLHDVTIQLKGEETSGVPEHEGANRTGSSPILGSVRHG